MRNILLALGTFVLSAIVMVAIGRDDRDIKQDIARHQAMAAAHDGAAKCLEAGTASAQCDKELVAACRGLGLGKRCGMKHDH